MAIVHDYLNEYGGAERVLETLCKMYPEAPIYTAFAVPGSSAQEAFAGRKIIQSWFHWVPFYQKLYSPLRFLIPWIWGPFNFSGYDLLITSASWYITKGLGKKFGVKELCYCHTPPRWLYGYETSINWKKWGIVRAYALVVGHFLRMYDFEQAQKVDTFIANSANVQSRIRKFYRRESRVIYPPIKIQKSNDKFTKQNQNSNSRKDYYLMVTRIVGGKGIEIAIEAAQKAGFKLVVAGEKAGWAKYPIINNQSPNNIQFLGRVSEEEKYSLMANAKAFLALARDEDFGITPIEAQAAGTPIIAYNGGGYKESVIDGKTGVLFNEYSADGLLSAIGKFNKLKWNNKACQENAKRFSEERFIKDFQNIVDETA